MSKKKNKCVTPIVGEELPIYLVGAEYDDFAEGGFSIVAVCTNVEMAKEMVVKTYQEFPGLKKNSISIRTLKTNHFYDEWL